ncbi:MAG: hypothetical protein A4E57_03644 [Syntrophorhabdaceae bacterium PtaU1.Bin034]|nr:MAG: hypothetical protein A4E57_03644 [Syntrophorhabdaceae bacterium PtaU1.Bin034]
MRGKVDAAVTLAVSQGVSNGDPEERAVRMGDRLRRAGRARREHQLGHIIIGHIYTNSSPISVAADNLLIGLHVCRRLAAHADVVFAVVHVLHDGIHPGDERFPENEYFALRHIARVLDIRACKTEVERTDHGAGLENSHVGNIPFDRVQHEVLYHVPFPDTALPHQIISHFVGLFFEFLPRHSPSRVLGRVALDQEFAVGKLACIEPTKS